MADVEGIAPNILTKRLRQLEIDSLVVSTPYSKKPVRLEYALTQPGHELAAALESLSAWGARQVGASSHSTRHGACGTPIETRAWCPTCNSWAEIEEDLGDIDWA